MNILKLTGLTAIALALGLSSALAAKKPVIKAEPGNPLGEIYSGYNMRDAKTQAMQDDDFDNPGFLWIEQGASLWDTVDGEEGKSCASCHGKAEESMKGVGAKFPKYLPAQKNIVNLELQINLCRKLMKAKPFKYESNEMMATAAFVKHQSRGMPVNVSIEGEAKKHWEAGKKFFYQRRGQLDMACSHCHEKYQAIHIRSDYLSQGHANGFPLFRLKWQNMGTLHRRFTGCNKNIRAQPYKRGSQEYLDLELYVTWRGNGLPIETPAVRQ